MIRKGVLVETDLYLQKALNSLKAAELCYDNKLYDDAVSRAYFAVLRIAVALLASIGAVAETRRIHAWVQANFSQQFVRRRKIYPKRLSSCLAELRNQRETADYDPTSVSEKTVRRILKQAREFVSIGVAELKK
jgi:uncharacterized protein (UPF0332 family)